MAQLRKFILEPGVHRESSQYAVGPTYYDTDKIRFRKGMPEQVGGWQQIDLDVTFPYGEANGVTTQSYRGVARSLFDWTTAEAFEYMGIGTNQKFYVERGEVLHDVTPLRVTTAAGDVTFAATNGSSSITVTDTAHGAVAGDYVTFSGAASLGGNITADVLNHEYVIDSITDVDNYIITARTVAGVETTANASDSGNGGASVVGAYQINTGTNAYIASAGYGLGAYGAGTYSGSAAVDFANQLRLWSQDSFGDDLIFCPRGGGVYYWDESGGVDPAARAVPLSDLSGASNTPTVAYQVMTSPVDRHVICFGVNSLGESTIDPLLVRWSSQENAAQWTPTATNTAGGQVLSTGTEIVGAVKTRQEILIFTDSSIHSMRFSGAPFVFQFSRIAEDVNIISPQAAVPVGDSVFFMDSGGFYLYSGNVRRLQCDVEEYVFRNLNKDQAYKVMAYSFADESEVTWLYPVGTGNTDNTNYVTYNYEDQVWTIGTFSRGTWIAAPTRQYPIASSNDIVNEDVNYLYEQEFGFTGDGGEIGAYFESGMFELASPEMGDGDSIMFLKRVVPDFRIRGTSGEADFTCTFKGTDFPQDTPTTRYTFTVTATTKQSHVRVRAREVILRVESNNFGYGWTMGHWRFELKPDGRR